eukprot:188753-Pyramimonas_sp.AAC.1
MKVMSSSAKANCSCASLNARRRAGERGHARDAVAVADRDGHARVMVGGASAEAPREELELVDGAGGVVLPPTCGW